MSMRMLVCRVAARRRRPCLAHVVWAALALGLLGCSRGSAGPGATEQGTAPPATVPAAASTTPGRAREPGGEDAAPARATGESTATAAAAGPGPAGTVPVATAPAAPPAATASASATASAAASAAPAGSASAAASAAPVPSVQGNAVADAPYAAYLAGKAAYRAGEPAAVTVVLEAKGGYKCNERYPYKFKLDPPPAGVSYPEPVARGIQYGPKRSTMPVAFVAARPGKATIAGTFHFSVCTAELCKIERAPLSLTVRIE
ncbi:MAG: hypothetical protein HY744_02915 [Deltaproteobacteria bacterium]|nr:hypothetical protein [Deltaproteobacteria bacterium]